MHKLKRLSDRHRKILDLCLEGLTRPEICHITGLTPQAITIITKSPLFQNDLARRRVETEKVHDEGVGLALSEAKSVMENASLDAARTHINLLSSNDERVQQKSASEILDRVGLGKSVEGPTTGQISLTVEQLSVLNVALKEA